VTSTPPNIFVDDFLVKWSDFFFIVGDLFLLSIKSTIVPLIVLPLFSLRAQFEKDSSEILPFKVLFFKLIFMNFEFHWWLWGKIWAGNANLFLKMYKNELFCQKIVKITKNKILINKKSKYKLSKMDLRPYRKHRQSSKRLI